MLNVFCEVGVKSFFQRTSFPVQCLEFGAVSTERRFPSSDKGCLVCPRVFEISMLKEWNVVGVKAFVKCLSRLETLRATPPLFLQLYFLLRLILGENWL